MPSDKPGTIEVWGTTDGESGISARATQAPDPEAGSWSAVTLGGGGNGVSFGITSAGTLKRLTGTGAPMDLPEGLTSALAISSYGTQAAAVTQDGSVQIWGDGRGIKSGTISPATLGARATDVAFSAQTAVILLEDGRVGTLFANQPYAILQFEGVDVDNAAQIDARPGQGFARLLGGGVVSWTLNGPVTNYPASVRGDTLADPVADFADGDLGLVAVTEAGHVHLWNSETGEPLDQPERVFPASSVDGKVTRVAASSKYFAALTASNDITVWGQFPDASDYPLVSTIPEEVDGRPITRIIGGEYTFAAIVSPSPAAIVPSTTTASAAASKYGTAGTVTVTVGNTAGRPVAGTVTLSGAGATQTATVTGGKATFALDRALAAGSHTLTAAYSGSPAVNASAGSMTFTVAKGSSSKPAFKATKVSTSKKKGKATVTVGTASGLAKATGKATVTLKKGKTTKKITATLSGGKKSISLPKLKKGTWKVQVSYNGDKNYVAQKSKSYNLKIKK